MAAALGVARRSGCAWNRHLFPVVCSSVFARVGSVLGEGCGDPRAARATAHDRALSHWWRPLLRCARTQPGRAGLDSRLGGCPVLWWAFRAGLDVDFALWSARPQQRIADARN